MSPTREDESLEISIPAALPLLAVRDVVVFPNMVLPLFVGREASVLAIEAALAEDRLLFLATQRDQAIESPEPEDIYSLGTVSLILRMLKLPDGRLKILVQGIIRVSGAQSGSATLGLLAYPNATGSGVAAPTGLTGLGATWTAIAPVAISSNPTGQIAAARGKVIGVNMAGGQTPQLDVLLSPGIWGYYG